MGTATVAVRDILKAANDYTTDYNKTIKISPTDNNTIHELCCPHNCINSAHFPRSFITIFRYRISIWRIKIFNSTSLPYHICK